MLTILNLFGRSPFTLLKTHMEKVSFCVHQVVLLFHAIQEQDYEKVEKIAHQISEAEHLADITKNDIRDHLPKSLFMAIDRNQILEILRIQDKIADQTEDIAVLATLKPLQMPPSLKDDFEAFLMKNVETFEGVHSIIKELHELLESSFCGVEADKVRGMVNAVAFKEHEVDIVQRKLLKGLFSLENELPYSSFHLWLRLFEATANLSNLSETLAYRMRMTLEMK